MSSRYLSYLLSPTFANSSTTWRNVTTVWPWSTYVDPGTCSQSRVSTETHEHRVNRNERKTKITVSFQAKYSGIFGKVTPFSKLKSVQD